MQYVSEIDPRNVLREVISIVQIPETIHQTETGSNRIHHCTFCRRGKTYYITPYAVSKDTMTEQTMKHVPFLGSIPSRSIPRQEQGLRCPRTSRVVEFFGMFVRIDSFPSNSRRDE